MRLHCIVFVISAVVIVTCNATTQYSTHSSSSDGRNDRAKRGESQVLDELIVDLKSKLYLHASDPYIYRSSGLEPNQVVASHLHSSQMNSTSLSKYFEIVNKTNIVLVSSAPTVTSLSIDWSNRRSMCSDVKMCNPKAENALTCLLNINMILYMSSKQIKLVNVALILNDLSNDYLNFEKSNYTFSVDPTISYEIGKLKISSKIQTDMLS